MVVGGDRHADRDDDGPVSRDDTTMQSSSDGFQKFSKSSSDGFQKFRNLV